MRTARVVASAALAALALWLAARAAAPPPTDPSPPARTPPDRTEARAVVDAINRTRAAAGSRPLRLDPALTRAAEAHSRDQAERGRMGHAGSDGSSFAARARRAGYAGRPLGECVAAGQPDAETVVRAWMTSPGHRAILTAPRAEEIGVAVVRGRRAPYWTALTGRSVAP